jgi:hypothetical protein
MTMASNYPSYADLQGWIALFKKDHYELLDCLDSWCEEARPYIWGDRPDRTELMELTGVLVAWCIHSSDAKIDPQPLQAFTSKATAWRYEDSQYPDGPPVTAADVREAYKLAQYTVDQIVIAIKVKHGNRWRPELGDTAKKAAAYIVRMPGKTAEAIAEDCGTSPDNFRRHIWPKLRHYGFANRRPGYYPPQP